jgi:hypothetical protein
VNSANLRSRAMADPSDYSDYSDYLNILDILGVCSRVCVGISFGRLTFALGKQFIGCLVMAVSSVCVCVVCGVWGSFGW